MINCFAIRYSPVKRRIPLHLWYAIKVAYVRNKHPQKHCVKAIKARYTYLLPRTKLNVSFVLVESILCMLCASDDAYQ